jgi:hypothetical protein
MNALSALALLMILGIGGFVAYTYLYLPTVNQPVRLAFDGEGGLVRLSSVALGYSLYHAAGIPDGAYGMSTDLFFANGTEVGGKGICWFVLAYAPLQQGGDIQYAYVTSLSQWGNPAVGSFIHVTGALVGSTGVVAQVNPAYGTVLDKLRVDTLNVVDGFHV